MTDQNQDLLMLNLPTPTRISTVKTFLIKSLSFSFTTTTYLLKSFVGMTPVITPVNWLPLVSHLFGKDPPNFCGFRCSTTVFLTSYKCLRRLRSPLNVESGCPVSSCR